MGAGTIYNNLGGTHMTQEDISICRSIPNFKIISPSDPNEMREAVKQCVKNKKPMYLRLVNLEKKLHKRKFRKMEIWKNKKNKKW